MVPGRWGDIPRQQRDAGAMGVVASGGWVRVRFLGCLLAVRGSLDSSVLPGDFLISANAAVCSNWAGEAPLPALPT